MDNKLESKIKEISEKNHYVFLPNYYTSAEDCIGYDFIGAYEQFVGYANIKKLTYRVFATTKEEVLKKLFQLLVDNNLTKER